MKNKSSIILYGLMIILAGTFLLFSRYASFEQIKITLGVTLSAGAILAFIAGYSRVREFIQFAYHEMHALTLLVYGISVLIFSRSINNLIDFTSFLLFFYSFSEIIFSNWLFNLRQRVIYKIIIVRLILGLAIGIGTVLSINSTKFTLEIFGILFIMVGANILLYAPVMKSIELNAAKLTTEEMQQE